MTGPLGEAERRCRDDRAALGFVETKPPRFMSRWRANTASIVVLSSIRGGVTVKVWVGAGPLHFDQALGAEPFPLAAAPRCRHGRTGTHQEPLNVRVCDYSVGDVAADLGR